MNGVGNNPDTSDFSQTIMAKIIAPNPDYNGISATVQFTNGVGETDNKDLIGWFKEHGYKVEKDSAKAELNKAELNKTDSQAAKPKGRTKKEKPEENKLSEGESDQTGITTATETENQ